jgi:hypothetical protein
MFANRDFEPGDIIIAEDPVLVGKRANLETPEQFVEFCADIQKQFEELDFSVQVSLL